MALLALLLVGSALAEAPVVSAEAPAPPARWRAEVAAGLVVYPKIAEVSDSTGALWFGVERVAGPWRYGAVAHVLAMNVMYYEAQVMNLGSVVLPGDFTLGCFGATVGFGHAWGVFGVEGRASLGLARYNVPIELEYYDDPNYDPVIDTPAGNDFRLTDLGPWAELSGDLSLALGRGGPSVFYGHSIGLPMAAGLGLERGLRLGVRAAF